MKFIEWLKIKEQAAAPAAPAAPAAAAAPASGSNSVGTTTPSVATVPQRLFSNERQTSSCVNCSKEGQNWYNNTKRRKKKNG